MAKAKQSKLTLAEYDRLDKQFSERKQVTLKVIHDGQEKLYTHEIAVKFKPTEIQKLTIDYLSILEELRANDTVTKETLYNANSLLNALIVKYFSDVPVPPLDNLQSVVRVSETLYNIGIMQQLFDDETGFPKEETDKLSKELDKNAKVIGQRVGELMYQQSLNESGEDSAVIQ